MSKLKQAREALDDIEGQIKTVVIPALKKLDTLENSIMFGFAMKSIQIINVAHSKLRAALTQPKADVDTLMKDVYAAYENDDDSHKKSTVAWVIDHLAAQGYISVPEGWQDISTIPDNLMSGVDLWDDREEKRYINCTFDLRIQAWADENSDFVKIPTHWMPLPAAPKKEV